MEWFDYESLHELDNKKSDTSSREKKDDHIELEITEQDSEPDRQVETEKKRLDIEDDVYDVLDSFLQDVEDKSYHSVTPSLEDEFKSDKSLKSMKSEKSQYSNHSGKSLQSLSEQLDKIDLEGNKAQRENDEKSISASSWFTWRRPKKVAVDNVANDGGTSNGSVENEESNDQADMVDQRNGNDCNENIVNINLDDMIQDSDDDIDFTDEIINNTNSMEEEWAKYENSNEDDLDFDANGNIANTHVENPNQPLFDIIEQGFESIDPFYCRGMSRELRAIEVKLCFATFIEVFSTPPPTAQATKYNHDIDTNLREERLRNQKYDTSKKRKWFWKSSRDDNEEESDTDEHLDSDEDGVYQYEIVPLQIVHNVWVEILSHVGIRLSSLNKNKRNDALSYLKDTLVQVGLLDFNIIDLNDGLQSSESDKLNCEYVAAHHAINGEYGKHLKDRYPKIAKCLSTNKLNLFRVASNINNELEISMRDYCVGMLIYTLTKAHDFERVQRLLCDEEFIRHRIEHFGILEGATVQCSDIEHLVSTFQKQHNSSETVCGDLVEFLVRAHDIVKSYIVEKIAKDSNGYDYNDFEEIGKSFHILGTSLISLGQDDNGLSYLLEAEHFKRKGGNPLDPAVGSVTLSDTLHCLGIVHGNLGDLDKTLANMKQALLIRRELLGNEDLRIAETCHKMGATLCEVGKFDDAAKLIDEALRIRKDNLPEGHIAIAEAEEWMGNVFREKGKYDEALAFYQSSLYSKMKLFGGIHEEVGTAVYTLAITLDGAGKYDEAITNFKEALKIQNELYGRSVVLAETYLCLGNSYQEIGEYSNALEQFKESISIREDLLTGRRIYIDMNFITDIKTPSEEMTHQISKLIECYEAFFPLYKKLHNSEDEVQEVEYMKKMGEYYLYILDFNRAMGRFQKALDISGAENTYLQEQIARIHIILGENDEAKMILIQCLTNLKQRHGNESPILVSTLFHLGIALYHLQQHKNGLQILETAINNSDESIDEELLAHTFYWIGQVFSVLKEHQMAVDAFLKALQKYRKLSHLLDASIIVKCIHCIGNNQFEMHQNEDALKSYNNAIKFAENKKDFDVKNCESFADVVKSAGSLYAQSKNYEQAKILLEKGLKCIPRGSNVKTAEMLHSLGDVNAAQGKLIEAKKMYVSAYNLFRQAFGDRHAKTISTAFDLAKLLDKKKDFDSSFNYFEVCLKAEEARNGKNHIAVGDVLFYIGQNYYERCLYDEALYTLEKALAIRKKELKSDHIDIASTLYKLGLCYITRDKTDKAILCYREALRVWKCNDKKDDASEVSFELAGLYEEQQQNALAANCYSECIELQPTSTRVPQIHFRLGCLYDSLQKYEEAISHYSQYLEQIDDEDSKDDNYFKVVMALATLFGKQKKYEEALDKYEELIEFFEVTDTHQNELSEVYEQVGHVNILIGDKDAALEFLQASLSIRKTLEKTDSNFIVTAETLVLLADVLSSIEDFDAAINCLLEALFIFKMKKKHVERLKTNLKLADLYQKIDKLEEAKETYTDALEIQKDLQQVPDIAEAKTSFKFASLLLTMTDDKESLSMFQRALAIYSKQAPGSIDHVMTLQRIGEIHMQNMKLSDALDVLQQAIDSWPNQNHDYAADCNRNVGVIHFGEGRYKEAIPYLNEAIKIYHEHDVLDERFSSSLHLLSVSLLNSDDIDKAKKFIRDALVHRKRLNGQKSLEYAQSLLCLGELEFKQGNFSEALSNLKASLNILKTNPDEVALDILRNQETLSRIYWSKKEYTLCTKLVDASIFVCMETCPEEFKRLSFLHLLRGKLFVVQGKKDNAYDQFKRSLAILKENGKEKEAVVEVLQEIACVLFEQKQYKSSLTYYQEAMRIMNYLGKPDLATKLQLQVSICFVHLAKYEDAMRSLKDLQTSYADSFGHDSVDDRQSEMTKISFYLGQSWEGLLKNEEAREAYLEAIGSYSHVLTPSISDKEIFASSQFQLGRLMMKDENEINRALEFLKGSFHIRKEILDGQSEDMAQALLWLSKVSILAKPQDKENVKEMLREAESIFGRCGRYDQQAACLSELGTIELLLNNLERSFSYLKKAWSIYMTHKLQHDSVAGNILYGLGFIQNQKLNVSKAIELLKLSLKLRIKHDGKNSLPVGKTCEQLGSCLMAIGQHEDSLKLYVTCLEIYKNEFGGESIDCARVMQDIATLYSYKQQYDLALIQLNGALDFMEKNYGPNSEHVATVLLRMGQVHDMRVDNEEAMECVTKALEIRIKLYSKEDERVAETYVICGRLLEDWGDIEEAMNCFQNALSIFQLKKGVEDKKVADIHDQIAGIYVEQGNYDAAVNSYNEALSIYQVQIGQRSSEVGHTLRNLGAIYDAKQDYEKSYQYYMDALKILRQSLGDNDLSVSLVLHNIGVNLARRKKYRKAIDLCTVALRIRKSQLPNDHLEIADTLKTLAQIFDDCNKDDQALKFYLEALSIYKTNFGIESVDVAHTLKHIGCIEIRVNDLDKAIQHLLESLDIFKMKQGEKSVDIADILHHLGRIFGKKAEYQRSLEYFQECLFLRENLLPPDDRNITDTRRFVDAIRKKVESLTK